MNTVSHSAAVPFSRPLDVAAVGDDATEVTLVAGDAERAALARINGLVGIDGLEADLTVSRKGRSGLHVVGAVKARIRQTCVVSLEPFDADILEPFDVHFLPEAEIASLEARRPKAEDAAMPLDDLPDPIVGGRIDLGALAAEFLALALDPYPRKPGVSYAEPEPGEQDADRVSPFAALSRLKTDRPL